MACASGIASGNSLLASLRAAFDKASRKLSAEIDFAFVFLSGDSLGDRAEEILTLWNDIAPNIPFFGCSAESLVGQGIEVEGTHGASVMLVSGMKVQPQLFELECIKTPDGPSVMGVSDELVAKAKEGLLVLACPVSFSIELLADLLEYEKYSKEDPVCPILGGYCSSQNWQSPSLLLFKDKIIRKGAIALALPDGWSWHTIVSQGCRPIGPPYVITRMDGHTICELGGKPAMDQLRDLFSRLPTSEQQMMSSSLMVGRAITEYGDVLTHGEYLIRAVQGIDPGNQGFVVTDRFQIGQTIRFHVRDAKAASGDLDSLLSKNQSHLDTPEAALVFTCNGRGSRMFSTANHDAQSLQRYFPNLPTAGIFAAGEFGPVANMNVVHGFTAIINLLVKS